MALSDNIKRAREKQGISQEFIADKLGVSRQAVSKWETGQAEPSTKNLLQLAELLKVDANLLLNESKERKVFAKENKEGSSMKLFKSFSLIVILAFAVASVCGMIKGLAALCVFIGIGQLVEGKEYYDNGKRKMAFLYWGVGIAVCICGVLSFTNWV